MYLRHALVLALIVGYAAPAFAGQNGHPSKGFWIVRGPDKTISSPQT